MAEEPEIMDGQLCPFCNKSTLTLMQKEQDIPFFGKTYIFSMDCSSCSYHKADVEREEGHEASKCIFEIENDEDMKVRVIKSSTATVRIPHVSTIAPGPASNGYITNIEGILRRVINVVEQQRDSEEDDELKKKAKNLIKRLNKVILGQEKLKIIIEDPSGNSAIISDRTVKSPLRADKAVSEESSAEYTQRHK